MKNKNRVLKTQAMFEPRNDGQFGLGPAIPDSSVQSPTSSNNLQSIINKMGGIDGILAKMENAQKFVQTISPILPIIASLLKKKKRSNKTNRFKRGERNTIKYSTRSLSNSYKNRRFRK